MCVWCGVAWRVVCERNVRTTVVQCAVCNAFSVFCSRARSFCYYNPLCVGNLSGQTINMSASAVSVWVFVCVCVCEWDEPAKPNAIKYAALADFGLHVLLGAGGKWFFCWQHAICMFHVHTHTHTHINIARAAHRVKGHWTDTVRR